MRYRVTGMLGDMPVDLTVEAPELARKSSVAKVSGMSDDELGELVEKAKLSLGEDLSRQASGLVDLMASSNKSGVMALSRVWREVWQPAQHAVESGRYSREALAHGISVAVAAGKPNLGYAKAVARSWVEERDAAVVSAAPKYRTVG